MGIFTAAIFVFAVCATLSNANLTRDEIHALASKSLITEQGHESRKLVNISGTEYFIGSEIDLYWFDAIEFCNAIGKRLASLQTVEENQLVRDYLNNNDGLGALEFWTSGHKVQGGWLWTGVGEIIKSFDWGLEQPDDAGGDVTIHLRGDFGWGDDSWTLQKNFICE